MTASKTGDRPSNLYRTALPGGEYGNRRIKAGSAVWWKPEEVPPRKGRRLDIAGTRFSGALERAAAPIETDDEGEEKAPERVQLGGETMNRDDLRFVSALSDKDTEDLFAFNDIIAWVYLKSWTLTYADDGSPVPLPEEPDDLLDLPRALYDALQSASAKIHAEAKVRSAATQFSVEAVEDRTSPTGASDD